MDGKGYPKWKTALDVNEGDELEYKYCIVGSDGDIARWENKGSSANRKCKVTGDMLNSGLKDKPFGGGSGGKAEEEEEAKRVRPDRERRRRRNKESRSKAATEETARAFWIESVESHHQRV